MSRSSTRGRRPRLVLLAALAGLAPVLFGCVGAGGAGKVPADFQPVASTVAGGRTVYFSMDDPRYDDKGPGRYVYPLQYENREGHFDITRFEVLDGGKNVTFVVSVRRPIPRTRPDGSTEHKGWSDHLVDIYVDKDGITGSGHTRALPGRNVTFDPASAWETCILVTPQRSYDIERLIENRTEDLELVRMRDQILVPERAYVDGYSFRISVPKAELGEPKANWAYQVLLVPFDQNNLSYGNFFNGRVRRFPDGTQFGGGDDSFGDPNVIDLLAPSEREQYRILGDFVSSPYAGDNRYAVISCIRGAPPAAAPVSPMPLPAEEAPPASAAVIPSQAAPVVVPIAPATAVKASSEATRYGLRRGGNTSPVALRRDGTGSTGATRRDGSAAIGATRFDSYRLPVAPGVTAEPLTVPVPDVPAAPPAPAPRPAPSALETHSFDFKL